MAKHKGSPFVLGNSWYRRGGVLRNKHNQSFKVPASYRNVHTGFVANAGGSIVGQEVNRKHHYAYDPSRIKNKRLQTRQQKAIMISLRKRRRFR